MLLDGDRRCRATILGKSAREGDRGVMMMKWMNSAAIFSSIHFRRGSVVIEGTFFYTHNLTIVGGSTQDPNT